MRAGIDYCILLISVRQKTVFGGAAECELQDPHARQVEIFAQRLHLGRDDAQVFGNDRQASQHLAQTGQKFHTRPRLPFADFGGGHSGRDTPIRHKPAKVVQPYQVHLRQRRAKTRHPPVVARLLEHLPVVERVAPQLPGLAEVIWRHARHGHRPALLVEQEDFRVRPHVGRVARHEDRYIADQPHALRVGVRLQPAPGAKK